MVTEFRINGLGLALTERIWIKDGSVEQSNLYDYQVMRMNDVSDIDIELVAVDNHPARARCVNARRIGEHGGNLPLVGNKAMNAVTRAPASSWSANHH